MFAGALPRIRIPPQSPERRCPGALLLVKTTGRFAVPVAKIFAPRVMTRAAPVSPLMTVPAGMVIE